MKPLEQVRQEAEEFFEKDKSYQNMLPNLKHVAWNHFWIGWLQAVYENEYESQSSNNPT